MKDLIIEKEGDLIIKDGDFLVEDSSFQNIEMIFKSHQGEFKENPNIGVNLIKSKSGVIDRFLKREITMQLELDGFNLEDISINSEGLQVTGIYGQK